MTLLVNYWQNKTAGEDFTHVIPQEELYMREASETMKEEHRQTMKYLYETNLSKSTTDPSINLPVAVTPTHVYMPTNHFTEDISSWQNQVLPEKYASTLLTMNVSYSRKEQAVDGTISPSKCFMTALPRVDEEWKSSLNADSSALCDNYLPSSEHPFTGGYIFHLARSDLANALDRDVTTHVINHWSVWNTSSHHESGVQVVVAGEIEETEKWRKTLPGGYDEPL